MRLKTCLAIGLAGLFAAHGPAVAGDLDSSAAGGIRNYNSGGVPVPVPTTYEESYKWYLRGDYGTAFKNSGTLDLGGSALPVTQPGDWRELSIISFGVGKYLTPSLRSEFTLDYRPNRKIEQVYQPLANTSQTAYLAQTTITYKDPLNPANTLSSGARQYVNNYYTGLLEESTQYENSTFLMSLYYDLNRGGTLRPYVGAGVGLAYHQLDINGKGNFTCDHSTITTVPDLAAIPIQVSASQPCTTGSAAVLPISYSTTTHQNAVGWGLAAHLSGGVTYDLSQRMHWDTGYRLLWQSGNVSVASADGITTIRMKDQFNHEVRTGVRWDIW